MRCSTFSPSPPPTLRPVLKRRSCISVSASAYSLPRANVTFFSIVALLLILPQIRRDVFCSVSPFFSGVSRAFDFFSRPKGGTVTFSPRMLTRRSPLFLLLFATLRLSPSTAKDMVFSQLFSAGVHFTVPFLTNCLDLGRPVFF